VVKTTNRRGADASESQLGTAVSAAAARPLVTTAGQHAELVLQAVVFTMERKLEAPTGAIHARAYPAADPLAASLDLAAQGITSVGIAVEVFDVPCARVDWHDPTGCGAPA